MTPLPSRPTLGTFTEGGKGRGGRAAYKQEEKIPLDTYKQNIYMPENKKYKYNFDLSVFIQTMAWDKNNTFTMVNSCVYANYENGNEIYFVPFFKFSLNFICHTLKCHTRNKK